MIKISDAWCSVAKDKYSGVICSVILNLLCKQVVLCPDSWQRCWWFSMWEFPVSGQKNMECLFLHILPVPQQNLQWRIKSVFWDPIWHPDIVVWQTTSGYYKSVAFGIFSRIFCTGIPAVIIVILQQSAGSFWGLSEYTDKWWKLTVPPFQSFAGRSD